MSPALRRQKIHFEDTYFYSFFTPSKDSQANLSNGAASDFYTSGFKTSHDALRHPEKGRETLDPTLVLLNIEKGANKNWLMEDFWWQSQPGSGASSLRPGPNCR